MNKTKRNVTIGIVAVCLCLAVYLNWTHNRQGDADYAMADAALASAKDAEETALSETEYISEYFSEARLTRQQSRDEALSLLEAAATSDSASQETIDSAMNSIAVMANYSMQETQIENVILAKDFSECVAFMSADGITIAVPASQDGLTPEEVARITDAVVAETGLSPTQIKIIPIKSPMKKDTDKTSESETQQSETQQGESGLVSGNETDETDANSAQGETAGNEQDSGNATDPATEID